MAIEFEWRIPRIWKDANDFITTVEFTIAITDPAAYPGQTSRHSGIIDLSFAALNADTATREQIAEAVITFYGDGFDDLVMFHIGELQFQHNRAVNEEVEVDGPDPVDPVDPPMPKLTARQLRLGLITNGITLASVEATIAAIPDDTDREIALVEWEYASEFNRDHHLILQVGTALGLTEPQIDAMWMAASTL